MNQPIHRCPACEREFDSILDYPRVRLVAFERLAIPEAVDYTSAAAARKQAARRRSGQDDWSLRHDGINMTAEVARLCSTDQVQKYFERLASLTGSVLKPEQLVPPGKPDTRFKGTFPVAGSSLYLSLSDSEATSADQRAAEIQVLCEGPNLGSAGGPTLQFLGPIALLRYEGLLAASFGDADVKP